MTNERALDRRERRCHRRGPPRPRLRRPDHDQPPPGAGHLRRCRADVAAGRLWRARRTDAAASPAATASATPTPASPTASAPTAAASGPLAEVPDETGGPYPGDGSNGVNVLDDSGIVRSDIRSSFGSSTTVAEGVPLTIALTVRDAATGAALAGRASTSGTATARAATRSTAAGVENENYLRGVQETDANGTVTFTSIYPGVLLGSLAAHPLRGVRRMSPPPSRRGRSSRRARSPCPPRRATRSTPRPATSRACATSRRSRCRATTCSATTAASTRSRRWRVRSPRATRRRSRSASEAASGDAPQQLEHGERVRVLGLGVLERQRLAADTSISTSWVSARRRSARKVPRSSSRS